MMRTRFKSVRRGMAGNLRDARKSQKLKVKSHKPPLRAALDQVEKVVEQVVGIMRSRRGLGVVLHAEHRTMPMPESFDGAVVQIDMRHLDIVGQRFRIDG